MGELSLEGMWMATWGDGLHGKFLHAFQPAEDPERYIPMQFPGSILSNLVASGLVDDPRNGINSLKARWVEEHFWILRKKFTIPDQALFEDPWLHLDILDGVAQIIVNGIRIGQQANANRPAEFDLRLAVQAGENEIVILLESGLFKVADLPGGDYHTGEDTILNKRFHLRQPQFQFGWDWNPRLVYFGLHGDLRVTWGIPPRLKQMTVTSTLSEDCQAATVCIHPSWFMPGDAPQTVKITAMCGKEIKVERTTLLVPGNDDSFTDSDIVFQISRPRLWWPLGHGEQTLYPIEFTAEIDGIPIARWVGKTGIRKIQIEQRPHPEDGNYFHLKVNNRSIFCKGSNWVPPEMSAFEVSYEKISKLVSEAVEQNFNILRIWGGAVWAGHDLLNLCDEAGLLVWHDLLFACSKYPVDQSDFLREVQTEITWGMREFSPHPSLAVWCGNNEMEWGWWNWQYQNFGKTAPDYALFHQVIPMILRKIDPTRPYWPSSPYSAPEIEPNASFTGDQHPWGVSIGDAITPEDFWKYRGYTDRFPNEGGVLGISPLSSIRSFLSAEEQRPRSLAWEHHDNTVSFWRNGLGVGYAMVERWLRKKVSNLSLGELCLASGIVQAEGLKEYIRNYRRRWPDSASAIYWDYSDSWPSIHGWGTLDYYLRRKPAFYAVKRANRPLIVVLADEAGEPRGGGSSHKIGVYVVNDTITEVTVRLEAGDFQVQGDRNPQILKNTSIPAFTSQRMGELEYSSLERVYYAVVHDVDGKMLDWDRLILDLAVFDPIKTAMDSWDIEVSLVETESGRCARYQSSNWIWNVVLDIDGETELTDSTFDLLPGIAYDVPLGDTETPEPVKATGFGLMRTKGGDK
jgi:beta-mannosidase